MHSRIGSRYFDTVFELEGKLIGGFIEVGESDPGERNHACYLCLNKIKGKVMVLKEKGEDQRGNETVTKYYLDRVCYKNIINSGKIIN